MGSMFMRCSEGGSVELSVGSIQRWYDGSNRRLLLSVGRTYGGVEMGLTSTEALRLAADIIMMVNRHVDDSNGYNE